MTYTQLTIDELTFIESYFKKEVPIKEIITSLKRSKQTIYNVINAYKAGMTPIEYYKQYKVNKARCGRKKIKLSQKESDYIMEKINQGWTPDTIIGRKEQHISCSVKTLYRKFKSNIFPISKLPMKGKRKPNNHKETRGSLAFKRNIAERKTDFTNYDNEFGHLEGDTIVGKHHKSAIITLVERVSKFIITLRPKGRTALHIENELNQMLSAVPKNLFKSIVFDCGKEFSNWQSISNDNDISIYFADPGTPSQRALNENSNGMLRSNGLSKGSDFNQFNDNYVIQVAQNINNRPRKSLNYRTPTEVFMSFIEDDDLSSLI